MTPGGFSPRWVGYAVQCQSSDEGVPEFTAPVSGAGYLRCAGSDGTRVCPGGEEVGGMKPGDSCPLSCLVFLDTSTGVHVLIT